jgi:peptidoglycan/LPS O-acetylase OafA/YrhL
MKVLDTVLKRENNNFDLIRLLAALMVLLFHTFYLFKDHEPHIHSSALLKGESIGGLAVYVFFFLSGMFITSSFINSRSNYAFGLMRIFRLWPALIVCVILTVFIAGPLVSRYPVRAYFASEGARGYLIHDILLYHIRYALPGVFETNYYPAAVNGSIWTLPIEIICYFMVYLLGIIRVFKNKIVVIIIYSLIITLYFLNLGSVQDYLKAPFPFFVAGSLFYIFGKNIIVDYKISIAFIIIYCIFFKVFFLYLAVVYGVLVLGSSGIFKSIKLPGDFSYGIYIYAFLIQQLVAHYNPDMTPYQSLFLTTPATVLMASLSWYFIEHPSIQFARKIAHNLQRPKTLALLHREE